MMLYDFDKPVPLLMPGMLTYKDDDEKSPYSPNGYSIGFNATMENASSGLKELLERPQRWDVRIQREPGRMPRKMKKAYHSDYKRDTKWKRKVANHLRRLNFTLHDAEVVLTQDHFDSLSAYVEATIRAKSKENK